MTHRYLNSNVPADLNFTDIEGPDGMVSHDEVMRALSPDKRYLVVGISKETGKGTFLNICSENEQNSLRLIDLFKDITGSTDDYYLVEVPADGLLIMPRNRDRAIAAKV